MRNEKELKRIKELGLGLVEIGVYEKEIVLDYFKEIESLDKEDLESKIFDIEEEFRVLYKDKVIDKKTFEKYNISYNWLEVI